MVDGFEVSSQTNEGVREGDVIADQYRIARVLGMGGMGVVVLRGRRRRPHCRDHSAAHLTSPPSRAAGWRIAPALGVGRVEATFRGAW
jgi:hypothetical protein